MKRCRRFHLIAPGLLAVWMLTGGCGTVPVTGRSQLNLLSAGEETQLGFQSFEQMKKEMPISTDPQVRALVEKVGKRIAASAGHDLPNAQWEFVVFESKEANAFCLPGGKVGVYRGILPITKDEAGLATVLGHEVAHAAAHHGAERMSEGMLIQMGGQGLGVALSGSDARVQQYAGTAYGLGAQLGRELPHSRKQESEADRIGLTYMAQAGYNPEEAVKFWQRFSEFNQKSGGGEGLWFLRTHPLDQDRIAELQKWMAEAKAHYPAPMTAHATAATMQVPFLDLAAQFAALREEILPVVAETLARGHYVLGPNVAALETEIAALSGARYGVGVNSGSDALTLALRALDLGPGDEVITTPFTYIAPAEAIHQVGAFLVFADIDPRTFTLDPAEVARRTTPRTRAIIPVHLFGQAAPLPPEIPVIEDCAQAIGATVHGRPVGGLGRLGCFSFYPTKNLGAAGDGGMVVTSDEALAKKLRMLRVHGIERRYFHDLHGYNSRLDELQAAILRVKLRHLAAWNQRRADIAGRYTQAFAGLPVETPVIAPGNTHVFHVFALLTDRRDALQQFLADRGAPTIIYYPQPLHLQKVYADLGFRPGDFPVAEAVSRRILPLPMYPELTDAQVDYVAQTVREFFHT